MVLCSPSFFWFEVPSLSMLSTQTNIYTSFCIVSSMLHCWELAKITFPVNLHGVSRCIAYAQRVLHVEANGSLKKSFVLYLPAGGVGGSSNRVSAPRIACSLICRIIYSTHIQAKFQTSAKDSLPGLGLKFIQKSHGKYSCCIN